MDEVWLVIGATGEWSDYAEWVESVWDSEAGALSHIVRDIGADLDADGSRRGRLSWTLDGRWQTFDYWMVRRRVRHGG